MSFFLPLPLPFPFSFPVFLFPLLDFTHPVTAKIGRATVIASNITAFWPVTWLSIHQTLSWSCSDLGKSWLASTLRQDARPGAGTHGSFRYTPSFHPFPCVTVCISFHICILDHHHLVVIHTSVLLSLSFSTPPLLFSPDWSETSLAFSWSWRTEE